MLTSERLHAPMQPRLSPTLLETPTYAMSLVARQRKLEERPEPVSGVDPYLQKDLNATQRAFAERELLKADTQELVKQNNEKRTHQHVKERKIGEAKIMAYEDIVEGAHSQRAASPEEAGRSEDPGSKQTTSKEDKAHDRQ